MEELKNVGAWGAIVFGSLFVLTGLFGIMEGQIGGAVMFVIGLVFGLIGVRLLRNDIKF